MRKDAYLANTSRGVIIDKKALESGDFRGAPLDVFEIEPPADWSLLKLSYVVCTQHIAQTAEARDRIFFDCREYKQYLFRVLTSIMFEGGR